jgi:hypothetical protein
MCSNPSSCYRFRNKNLTLLHYKVSKITKDSSKKCSKRLPIDLKLRAFMVLEALKIFYLQAVENRAFVSLYRDG